MVKIGLIRETKIPSDIRVALTPLLCRSLLDQWNEESLQLTIVAQSSDSRCFTDSEYEQQGVPIVENVSDCDILLGVKEVKLDCLQPNCTYFMFSHTMKKQAYNRGLLQEILRKSIRLIDYELLMEPSSGARVVSFSRWAGIAGTHNAFYTWGKRTGAYCMPRIHELGSFETVRAQCYASLQLPALKIVLTGDGKVSSGSCELLQELNVRKISVEDFLAESHFDSAVYCQLTVQELYARLDGGNFDVEAFSRNPVGHFSIFAKFLLQCDIIVNGIYWDNRSPSLFTLQDLRTCGEQRRVKVIADISCDIAPEGSIPCTLRASTIDQPVFGFNIETGQEDAPYGDNVIDIMAVDNLPNELPREASEDFGRMFQTKVLPEIMKERAGDVSLMLDKATIANKSSLTAKFQYLQDYVEGN